MRNFVQSRILPLVLGTATSILCSTANANALNFNFAFTHRNGNVSGTVEGTVYHLGLNQAESGQDNHQLNPLNPANALRDLLKPKNKAESGQDNHQLNPPKNLNKIGNLLELIESNGQLKTFRKCLKAAGLIETLQSKDKFTIFAPSDIAFDKLPADAVRNLLKPENKDILNKILTYHILSSQILSTNLKPGEFKSIEGGSIIIKVDRKNNIMINDSKITQTDIKTNNGVIHIIDKLLLPPDL
jgi:uncharacterized surface protein with fasciclin (FAS1) repeats